jgi:hypothetical protein
MLEWISAVDSRSRHEAVSRERVENSGAWFLQSEAYQSWLKGTSSNLLCYQGIRGISRPKSPRGLKPATESQPVTVKEENLLCVNLAIVRHAPDV